MRTTQQLKQAAAAWDTARYEFVLANGVEWYDWTNGAAYGVISMGRTLYVASLPDGSLRALNGKLYPALRI